MKGEGASRLAVGLQIKRIRKVMGQYFEKCPVELGGEGKEVQMDETVIGHRKYNVG